MTCGDAPRWRSDLHLCALVAVGCRWGFADILRTFCGLTMIHKHPRQVREHLPAPRPSTCHRQENDRELQHSTTRAAPQHRRPAHPGRRHTADRLRRHPRGRRRDAPHPRRPSTTTTTPDPHDTSARALRWGAGRSARQVRPRVGLGLADIRVPLREVGQVLIGDPLHPPAIGTCRPLPSGPAGRRV